MKVNESPANLLETQVQAQGNLDGMEVNLSLNYILGMPGDSQGTLVFQGNVTQLLCVLSRVWPTLPDSANEVSSPGRQTWPTRRANRKEPKP
jgi:hypothetical protein